MRIEQSTGGRTSRSTIGKKTGEAEEEATAGKEVQRFVQISVNRLG
jgi:hypothetical protein